MAFIKEPPPTYSELLITFHRWVARLYEIKITCTVDDGRGNSDTATVDRRACRTVETADDCGQEVL